MNKLIGLLRFMTINFGYEKPSRRGWIPDRLDHPMASNSVNGHPTGVLWLFRCLWLFMGIHDGRTFVADIGNKGWLYRGPQCMMGIKGQFAIDKRSIFINIRLIHACEWLGSMQIYMASFIIPHLDGDVAVGGTASLKKSGTVMVDINGQWMVT